jgi:hypothetical protein
MPEDQHPAPIREEAVWLRETVGQPLVAQEIIASDAGMFGTDRRGLACDSDQDTLSQLIRAESKGTERHRAVRKSFIGEVDPREGEAPPNPEIPGHRPVPSGFGGASPSRGVTMRIAGRYRGTLDKGGLGQ